MSEEPDDRWGICADGETCQRRIEGHVLHEADGGQACSRGEADECPEEGMRSLSDNEGGERELGNDQTEDVEGEGDGFTCVPEYVDDHRCGKVDVLNYGNGMLE